MYIYICIYTYSICNTPRARRRDGRPRRRAGLARRRRLRGQRGDVLDRKCDLM